MAFMRASIIRPTPGHLYRYGYFGELMAATWKIWGKEIDSRAGWSWNGVPAQTRRDVIGLYNMGGEL